MVNGYASLTNATISYDDGLTVNAGSARTASGFGLDFAGASMHHIGGNAIVVAGSPLSVTNVVFSQVGGDGIDSTNSGEGTAYEVAPSAVVY